MAAVQTVAPVAVLVRLHKFRRPRLSRRLRVLWVGLFWIGMLGGCAAPGTPPVTDRSLANRNQQTYVVVRGDTLYSIAWRFNLDHRRLATANGIGAPFTIYPGQKLRLSETPKSAPARVEKTRAASLTVELLRLESQRQKLERPLNRRWRQNRRWWLEPDRSQHSSREAQQRRQNRLRPRRAAARHGIGHCPSAPACRLATTTRVSTMRLRPGRRCAALEVAKWFMRVMVLQGSSASSS